MNPSRHHQRGLTIISVLLLIGIAGGLLAVAFKLAPHYMQFATIRSIMDQIRENPESKGMTKNLILDQINKRLYINDIRSIDKKAFKLKRVEGGREISIEYEVRQPLFGNLSALMDFSYAVTIPKK